MLFVISIVYIYIYVIYKYILEFEVDLNQELSRVGTVESKKVIAIMA